jgi:hypothetical protein
MQHAYKRATNQHKKRLKAQSPATIIDAIRAKMCFKSTFKAIIDANQLSLYKRRLKMILNREQQRKQRAQPKSTSAEKINGKNRKTKPEKTK